MGTYLDYFGDPTIPEEKREEFTQRVLTILDQGGMLDLEDVSLFGKRVWLLKPPQALPGKDTIPFCYNYFLNRIAGKVQAMSPPPADSIPTKWAGASSIWSAPPSMYSMSFIRIRSALQMRTTMFTTPGRSSAG